MEDTENSEFDQIIGAIEDIAISDDFQALQTGLLEKYYHHFEVISITQTSSKKGELHDLYNLVNQYLKIFNFSPITETRLCQCKMSLNHIGMSIM